MNVDHPYMNVDHPYMNVDHLYTNVQKQVDYLWKNERKKKRLAIDLDRLRIESSCVVDHFSDDLVGDPLIPGKMRSSGRK